MPPIRKRCFLLLEVVISLTLLTLCLFPLIKPLVFLHRAEAKRFANVEHYRKDQNELCKLKERLFERSYSWDKLKEGTDELRVKKKTVKDQKEGLLLEAKTTYGTHKIFVERS